MPDRIGSVPINKCNKWGRYPFVLPFYKWGRYPFVLPFLLGLVRLGFSLFFLGLP